MQFVILNTVIFLKLVILFGMAYKIFLHLRLKLAKDAAPLASPSTKCLPLICVQLPLYNEPDHVSALLETVAQLDWQTGLLEVQILDDSTDQTTTIAAATLGRLKRSHPHIRFHHIRRTSRQGFKAGALGWGMQQSKAKFFAIFDCDFRPEPQLLINLFSSFTSSEVAAVQAAWSYPSDSAGLLGQVQRKLLNHHFLIEQTSRSRNNLPLNFNGTAGIWRRSAIEAAGGWSSRTVTEDLYLSYIVQMQGQKIVFRNDLHCLSALPSDLPSFLIQQRRWALGNGQVLSLLSSKIRRSSWSWSQKLDVLLHLTGYSTGLFTALLYLLLPLWIYYRGDWLASTHWTEPQRLIDSLLWLSLIAGFAVLYASRTGNPGQSWRLRFTATTQLLLVAPTISILVCPAYFRGLAFKSRHQDLEFNRTPKSVSYTSNLTSPVLPLYFFAFWFAITAIVAAAQLQFAVSLIMIIHSYYSLKISGPLKPTAQRRRTLLAAAKIKSLSKARLERW